MLIICIMILFAIVTILFYFIVRLNFMVVKLCDANEAQDDLNNTYGSLIVENAKEISQIKNNIHQ